MATPGKPRQSGIPAPGRASGLPTPGRSRSSSNVYQTNPAPPDDISRAFADAIKANDPSQHRIAPPSLTPSSSLSPLVISNSLSSGRRSVAGRPSSSASTSSVKVPERAKTPISARLPSRPPSRQSEVMTKAPKFFEVGDNVRIESLGFEGTLRYIGEIDGKAGLWAGVELSGGFSGKGKNDGTVGGKQYFFCPDKCGVFVATTKLSAPTVGPGAVPRPSSVASSRGGRTTPANGRTTPSSFFSSTSRTPSASYSNGRATPSAGRSTPSSNMGTIRPRTFKTPTSKPAGASLTEKITAGSRASKYMTMTAQQLSSRDRDVGADSPTRKGGSSIGLGSPSISRTLSSPTRSSGSPFSTPKPANGRTSMTASPSLPSLMSRTSMSTPRARIPSGIAMPPPPSPKTFHSISPLPTDSKGTPGQKSANGSTFSSSRPSSSASHRSTGTDEPSILDQLQSRLEAAEYENERLRTASDLETEAKSSAQKELERLRQEQQSELEKYSALETKYAELERRLHTQDTRVETLEEENEKLTAQVEEALTQVEQSAAVHQQDSETRVLEVQALQTKVDEVEGLNKQKNEVNEANSLHIKQLEADLEKAYTDMEEERKELVAQIDELRVAGQETIALYEERLSVADDQRYDLQHRISVLETKLSSMTAEEHTRETASPAASSATQIDNETLRDQVQHLQRKSAKLEEQLEDARAALERDASSYQDKIARIRLEDEQRKRDFSLKSRELEQSLKTEANARNRIEEIEEALRESTVALETTRGEVEVLRAELTNLDVLIDDATEDDISSKLANFTKKVSAEKVRYQKEINSLEQAIKDLRAENELASKNSVSASSANSATLQETLDSVNGENDELREQVLHLQERLSDLKQTLDAKTAELEAARKKTNRDAAVTSSAVELTRSSSKSDSSAAREEVAGLKHIVQALQKENNTLSQQVKLMESENQLLSTEAEQLRQEVHILEDNLDNSLRETGDSLPSPAKSVPKATEQNTRLEGEMDQLRKRLNEMEIKHARVVHDLNKEISGLEALVESKIYREDELEQEVEKLKEKLSRRDKKSSKNGVDGPDSSRHRLSSASSLSTASSENPRGQEVCEICERPGHDIFNCSLLKDEAVPVICEDCESPGHVAADCPHSQEVF
ncbi:hypothetical protein BDN70DRAFT_876224 [Pholiota conissans]|uniref:CAP-Gly domain-containing protein n=1 Tax=Pholiota conissans TaxID=109636 RepID=A0A9P5Z7F8_9AGAR|nr:hypothetical protein BDN70DRAFT_876224 [Pholiota conissans]